MMEVEGPVTSSLVSFIFVVLILREGRDWRECLVIVGLGYIYLAWYISFDVHASSLDFFVVEVSPRPVGLVAILRKAGLS